MATKVPAHYIETATHYAACMGADATERAIVMCFAGKVTAKRAGELIGTAANFYAGEKKYEYLAELVAAVRR